MRIIGIVLCALGFASGETRADILELLKTHKIVLGHTCLDEDSKPCTPPKMNPESEIRLVDDVIVHLEIVDKTGIIYPLKGEKDIVNHPLMAGYFKRQSKKTHYLKTQAIIAGSTLTLVSKDNSTESYVSQHPFLAVWKIKTEVSGTTCTMTHDSTSGFTVKNKWDPSNDRYRSLCEIVPLETGAASAQAPQWRTLTFSRINSTDAGKHAGTDDLSFKLINDRLYYTIWGCSDDSQLSAELDWRGGSLQGGHECQSGKGGRSSYSKASYSSTVKIDGNRHEMTATGGHNTTGFAAHRTSFEFDIRFILDGDKCRIEQFHKKMTYHTYGGSPVIYSANAQSTCYLD